VLCKINSPNNHRTRVYASGITPTTSASPINPSSALASSALAAAADADADGVAARESE